MPINGSGSSSKSSLKLTSATISLAANQTRYFGQGALTTVEDRMAVVVPYATTLKNMYVYTKPAPGVGESVVFTIMINGVAGNQTCTIAGANTSASDLVNTDVLVAGDLVSCRCVSSTSATTTYPKCSFEETF